MRLLPLVLILFAVAGCPGGGSSADSGVVDEASIGCTTDPQAEMFSTGMKKMGAMGMLSFTIATSDPAPPARGNDTWTIRVEKNGQAQTGASVGVALFMPKHGHGTSVVPMVMPTGDGYTLSPLYFFMPGLWRITLTATVAGTSDSAEFFFCIEG